jgi:hypothetical protein
MTLRTRMLIVPMVLIACAGERLEDADGTKPAASWWAWIAAGQVIGAAAPERAPGGPEAWLSALQDAAGAAPLAVINLRQKGYPELAGSVAATLHLPVEDYSPPTVEQADRAIAFIEDQVAKGRVVVVHCHGGCGRTGTILAAWLKGRDGLDATAAISRVREGRSCFVETPAQEAFIHAY